jgi:hypothetical protein
VVRINSFKWRTGQWEVVLDMVTAEKFEGYVYDKNSTTTQRWWFPRNTNSIAFTDPYSLPISVKRLVRQMLKQPLLSIEGYIGMQ